MTYDGLIGLWRPVGIGRHAFGIPERKASPGELVKTFCGIEVEAWRLHRQPSKYEWITEPTCMDCWHVLANRQ